MALYTLCSVSMWKTIGIRLSAAEVYDTQFTMDGRAQKHVCRTKSQEADMILQLFLLQLRA